MPDIVFDFSSSPVGGGLRRIDAYARYFSASGHRTIFLVTPPIAERIGSYSNIDVRPMDRSSLAKAVGDSRYLRSPCERPRWLFSYGIPIHAPIGARNWFHVSNALPLCLGHVTLPPRALLRMSVLAFWIKVRASRCDVVSGESHFTLARYDAVAGHRGDRVVLQNGSSEELAEAAARRSDGPAQPVAVVVGTAPYKRIRETYEVFTALKREFGWRKMVILGSADEIPKAIRDAHDVERVGHMNDGDYMRLMSDANAFLSMSEAENSSSAVLEGLTLAERVVLSDIPSHAEMIRDVPIERRTLAGISCLLVEPNREAELALPTWDTSIEVMLAHMGLA